VPADLGADLRQRAKSEVFNGLAHLRFIVVFAAIFPSISWGGTFVAFGPENFIRDRGQPVDVTRNFAVLNANTTYTLRIANGGLNGEFSRVSSGVITLNGNDVVRPNDMLKITGVRNTS
jgi:hypothetical protein